MKARDIVLSIALIGSPVGALACQLALVLAVDVSGSVDAREYDIQMQGLAAALEDGIVIDALIEQKAMLTLLQWTGSSRQQQTIPWTRITSALDVADFASRVAQDKRVWRNYSTAIGEALTAAQNALAAVPECTRKVIDISGDGISNEGVDPNARRAALADMNVTVNALAIETDETDLTAWFFENLILGEGAFVVTANGFDDYPEQIKRKLQRETTRQLSGLR
jgi:Ca-activated chloride channel family protein